MSSQSDETDAHYVPPYRILARAVREDTAEKTVTIPVELFQALLQGVFANAGFDAEWYRATYRDVALAMRSGAVPSELWHFVSSGYREERLPKVFDVDERWYRAKYPDVDASIKAGKVATAHHHYNSNGYFEGRYPNASAEKAGEWWRQRLRIVESESLRHARDSCNTY